MPTTSDVTVFRAGEGGFPCVRVPSLVYLPGTETLLAFAECRNFTGDGCYKDPQHNHSGDERLRVPCMKQSADGGKSWGGLRALSKVHGSYPTVAFLPESKKLLLQYSTFPGSYGEPVVQQMASTDLGVTWSAPARVAGVPPNVYLGGCHGAVSASGRVLFAAYNHTAVTPRTFETRVWRSDDGGATYTTSPEVIHSTAEPSIAAINRTSVEIVGRTNGALGCACQDRTLSHDGGASWGGPVNVSDLVSPGCQGSVAADVYQSPSRLLYSGPSSPSARRAMAVWESRDHGARWSQLAQLSAAEVDASYSCLETTPRAVHVLWETGPDEQTPCYGPTCRVVLSTLARV